MKRKIFGILLALVLVFSFTLMTAVPVFAADQGSIVDNDLTAQWIAASSTKCVQQVTISNSAAGAGVLDIDRFAVTNGGTAGDADVTRVAIWEDTAAPFGTWDIADNEIGWAADFSGAGAIGVDDDGVFLSIGVNSSKVVFVVVTTDAAANHGNTFLTTIDGSDLAGTSVETWDGTGGIATATSATTIDTAAPTVAITSTASPGPTNTSPIPMTATFSEDVFGFVEGDIIVGNGAADNFVGGPAVYTFDVTPASQGAVTVDIAAAVAQDAAGNDNTVAPQFTITYDNVAPTVAITSTASPGPTNTSPIPVTATFSEDVFGFVVGGITVGNGAADNFVGGPAVYTFDVTPAAQGAVTVDIAAGVAQDAADNDNTAAPQFTITYAVAVGGWWVLPDTTPPSISNISASNITETSTDICWKTNEKSTSQVEYWSSPGTLSALDETMVINHLVHLTDLTPGTAYHYKTMSKDRAGNLTVSDEDTFTTQKAPAAVFSASDLSISPSEVDIGETVTISVLVANTGNAAGDYVVTLKINDVAEATKEVTLDAGASTEVTFTTSRDVAGSYSVDVNGLSGSFTVTEEVAPAPPAPPPPAPPPEVKAPINWPVVGGSIAGVVIVGLAIFFIIRRRRAL